VRKIGSLELYAFGCESLERHAARHSRRLARHKRPKRTNCGNGTQRCGGVSFAFLAVRAFDGHAPARHVNPIKCQIHFGRLSERALPGAPGNMPLSPRALRQHDVPIHENILDRAECEGVAFLEALAAQIAIRPGFRTH